MSAVDWLDAELQRVVRPWIPRRNEGPPLTPPNLQATSRTPQTYGSAFTFAPAANTAQGGPPLTNDQVWHMEHGGPAR